MPVGQPSESSFDLDDWPAEGTGLLPSLPPETLAPSAARLEFAGKAPADHSFDSAPSGFVPIVTSPPADWRITYNGTGVDAYPADRELAWTLLWSDEPLSGDERVTEFDDDQIIQSGDLILIPGDDGYVYAVRVSPTEP